ncbi:hypothetical protein U8593_07990 [Aquirufa antheringensis]
MFFDENSTVFYLHDDKKPKAIFFCSAYNDISYILAEVKFNMYDNFLVFVVNNFGAYRFLDSLCIDGMKLTFLRTNLRQNYNPLHWVMEFFYVHFWLFFKLFKIRNLPIYFYATYYDTISIYAAVQLSRNNKLILGYLPDQVEFTHISRRFYDRIISILYLAPIHTYRGINGNVISGLSNTFFNCHFNIGREISIDELIDIQIDYSVTIPDSEFFVILLTSKEDSGITNQYSSVEELYLFVIKQLRFDEIYTKAHPRLGMASFLSPFNFKEIDSNIPIEFLNINNCRMVIGINSIALCHFANKGVKTISILNLMHFESFKIRHLNINYLKQNSYKNDIFFPNTLDDLVDIINCD